MKRLTVTLTAVLFLLTSLVSSPVSAQSPEATAAAPRTQYPLTIENCGSPLTFAAAPTGVITLANNTTEIMLALGLEDHMAGIVGKIDKLDPDLQARATNITIVAETAFPYPSREVILEANPDFLLSGYGGDFTENAYGSREYYADQNVATFYMTDSCGSGDRITLEDTYTDILTLGQIFDVQDRAQALVASMQATAGDYVSDDPVSVFVFSGDTVDSTATIGGAQLLSDLVYRAGGKNIFGDLDEAWMPESSMEEILAHDPDFIVITQYAAIDPDDIIAYWKQDPIMSQLSAVQNDRIVVISTTWTVPSIHNGDAIRKMHDAFYGN